MTAECIHREICAEGQIEVWQEKHKRSLWFDDVILQTEIDLRKPDRLPNPANRAMLAHLLFGRAPERVLLAGCGGGAIARWFHARDPDIEGDAVEISAPVARLARSHFAFPEVDSGWRIHTGDVRDYVASGPTTETPYDFILVDLAEQQLTPDWVTSEAFLAACARRLGPDGVLSINLIIEDEASVAQAIWNLRQMFDRRALALPVPAHDNLIIMAFKQAPNVEDLAARAALAEVRWQLEFPMFLQRLIKTNPPGSGIF